MESKASEPQMSVRMLNAKERKGAPYSLPVRRLDDVKAARELDLAYKPAA